MPSIVCLTAIARASARVCVCAVTVQGREEGGGEKKRKLEYVVKREKRMKVNESNKGVGEKNKRENKSECKRRHWL